MAEPLPEANFMRDCVIFLGSHAICNDWIVPFLFFFTISWLLGSVMVGELLGEFKVVWNQPFQAAFPQSPLSFCFRTVWGKFGGVGGSVPQLACLHR